MESIVGVTIDPSFPATILGLAAIVAAGAFLLGSPSSETEKKAKTPPHVFSFVPYLGSALEMGGGITEFIRKYGKKFQSPVFTATIMGDKCVFLADSETSTIVFSPSFQRHVDDLSLQKQFSTNVLTTTPEENDLNFNPSTNRIAGGQFNHYIFKGDELNKALIKAQERFIDVLPQMCNTKEEWKTMLFAESVTSAVFKGTMAPFISHDLANDEAFRRFREFDAGIIMMFNQAPSFLTKAAANARDALLEQFRSSKFWESASPFMRSRREKLPFTESMLSKVNLGIFWASVGNTAPAIFWMMVCLLAHPDAHKACLDQVQEIVDAKRKEKAADDDNNNNNDETSSSYFSLDDLDKMTYLESAFLEAIRLYNGAFTSRVAKKDFVLETRLGPYQIQAGCKLMSWWGLLHSDPEIFDQPNEFQFDRFVDGDKVFTFPSSGKPVNLPVSFGGGSHLCPGRKFANYEARLLCAMMLLRFDMKLLDPIPAVDTAQQGIGISQPKTDPRVSIRLRQVS